MTLSQLKIMIQEEIKRHKTAIDCLPWHVSQQEVYARISAFEKVIEMIEGPNHINEGGD